ncbi:helix-turn-helix domain-containing protein [Nocardia pseudobrasiliensis]|uniref:Helix-turn-helix protein n=1 Tax=Nocardia pseudobrasiliensis TaxID=45979 RepID=A0A370I6M7_9NOCA|nr:helix-turn-helix domain-containing protein [Nocardia pseudobrasiliensis]RDI66378.1 helix-turn-helix protein [Nocardia pseudobrasiliensis]
MGEWDFAGPADAGPMSGVAMLGFRDRGGAGLDLRVAGAPVVTVLIGFGNDALTVDNADGRQTLTGFVAGLPIKATRIRGERAECVEVRLSPLRARALLGVAPTDLGSAVLGLEDLWGSPVSSLRERLAEAASWECRFDLTKTFLAQRESPSASPDPEVIETWNRIIVSRGQGRVAALAESCGWSRKRLWARFEAQTGLTPKRFAMLVRFRSAVDGLLAGRPAAEVAAACGYTDQAHLCRDVAIFTERPPGALTAQHLPTVARYRHRAWGTFFQYGVASADR